MKLYRERGVQMNYEFLLGPVVGAIIGGITNGIAIKMLFRPIKPIKIGGYTVPFTPGVIPKEKPRIARKIGAVISKELLNEDVLKTWLLKEEIYQAIGKSVDSFFQENSINQQTIEEALCEMVGKERSTYYTCEIEEQLTEKLYHKLLQMNLGNKIVDKIQSAFSEGRFGNLLGPMSFLINDSLVENILHKIEPVINQMIEEEGEAIIRQAVEEESEVIRNTSIGTIVKKGEKYTGLIKQYILKAYRKLVIKYLAKILETLNIEQIVEERIMMLDELELEKIILSIMHKELNAIVGFGVLLGAIMGCIMSFI